MIIAWPFTAGIVFLPGDEMTKKPRCALLKRKKIGMCVLRRVSEFEEPQYSSDTKLEVLRGARKSLRLRLEDHMGAKEGGSSREWSAMVEEREKGAMSRSHRVSIKTNHLDFCARDGFTA
ncbi:hypothetical protein C8R45DRAFT_1075481 [Mycena sanguinolenta]|nr:hypothetical protein C8R45DRAFT_1075481 [Mycena sanguinolenta]